MTHGRMLATYAGFVCIMCTLLGGYVACGAQTYRVSVADDTDVKTMRPLTTGANVQVSNLVGVHSSKGWGVNLPVPYFTSKDLDDNQVTQLQNAMHTWEITVGKQLFEYRGVEAKVGDDFHSLYLPLEDSVNSHYFDPHWLANTNKAKTVLATTIWENDARDSSKIVKADIRYNLAAYVFGDSLVQYSQGERVIVDLQSLALHELGHLLGLSHITIDEDRYSIMNPALFIGEGMITRRVSNGDIERIRTIYGVGDPSLIDGLEKADDYIGQ